MDDIATNFTTEIQQFFAEPNAYRSVLILVATILISYLVSRFISQAIVKLAQIIGTKSDSISNQEKLIRYRQIETYLSITVAVVRASVVAVVAYIAWRIISPPSTSGAAAIGASAFFIVFAGQTLGMVLRDIATGAAMIVEGWFHVGDFIKVEPFIDAAGVVERFTLRSTKLRSLSGEIVWIHNQHIQAVHVTPNGLRTYAVDVFTKDPERAAAVLQEIIDAVPSSAAMVAKPLKLGVIEEWNDGLWHIVVEGRTAPGREWLIENFFVGAIKEIDDRKKQADKIFVYEPTARYADPVAERKFKRAVRSK
ncbi:MAG: mechanosensitive ion channel MscS, small conductance mechanosensitive channel [Candidatus Saccharibacteria bacterium]|nr:mechanosensitive ion channel MscS, small conductance mechanosensitive channel [Candidatus Saccharibacteria bacterium]